MGTDVRKGRKYVTRWTPGLGASRQGKNDDRGHNAPEEKIILAMKLGVNLRRRLPLSTAQTLYI